MNIKPCYRRFYFWRDEDVSGVSGVGRVAEGIVFSDGVVIVHWLSQMPTTTVYANLQQVRAIHGHGGGTKIVFEDPDPLEADEHKDEEETIAVPREEAD